MFEICVCMYQRVGPGSCSAPEILALPWLQIDAWGEQRLLGMKTSQTCSEGRCWFSNACKCGIIFPPQTCMLFFQKTCIHLRRTKETSFKVLMCNYQLLWWTLAFLCGCIKFWMMCCALQVGQWQIPGHSFGLLSIVSIVDPTVGTVPAQRTCTVWAAVSRPSWTLA